MAGANRCESAQSTAARVTVMASLADAGQQMRDRGRDGRRHYVVVDGHKLVRCLRRLHRETVAAVVWEMSEPEALIFRQLLRTDAIDSPFEQGWLLRTLHEDHGITLDVLARRFDRSVSRSRAASVWCAHCRCRSNNTSMRVTSSRTPP